MPGFKIIMKRITDRLVRPVLQLYLLKEHRYHFRDMNITVKPGVFHPGMFFTSKLLLRFLDNIELTGKHFLELGCGSGMIAVHAAKLGAQTTASDISETAVENTLINARLNNVKLSVVQSDLFENISDRSFEIIAVNPPFFPFQPENESEYAWYSGKEYAYFKRLFEQLPHHIIEHSSVFMILADVCDVDYIEQLARQHDLSMKKVYEKHLLWETEIIFEIRKTLKYKPIDSCQE